MRFPFFAGGHIADETRMARGNRFHSGDCYRKAIQSIASSSHFGIDANLQ